MISPDARQSSPLSGRKATYRPVQILRASSLEAPIAAHGALWIATANDISSLRPTILDRFLVLPVCAPDSAAAVAITKRIYRTVAAPHGDMFAEELDDDVARAAAATTPRQQRLIFQIAVGFAAAERRRRLSSSDVENARRLLESREQKAIGFLTR